MRRSASLSVCLLILIAAGCERRDPTPGQTAAADQVFLHGGVYTVEPDQPWAEAVAVRFGEIIYVGSDAGAEKLIGADNEAQVVLTLFDGKPVYRADLLKNKQ